MGGLGKPGSKAVLLCGAWDSPVVVGGLGKPGSETVLLCGTWGSPVVVGSPEVKGCRCCLFQSARNLPKGVVELASRSD